MFRVYEEVCIGCGICRTECPNQAIEIKNKIAVLAPGAHCMSCGHCVAICPFNAVWQEGLDMSDVIPVTLSEAALKPNELLRAIKGRRSIRRFRTQQVEREKFEAMLEAARFTPSGSNRQGLSFVVVQDDIKNFTRLTIEALRRLGERLLSEGETDSLLRFYAPRFVELARQYEESDGAQDGLFFNAPAVIAVVGTRTIDAGLAASNMELMAFAEGLGAVFSGFLVRAAADSAQVRDYLGVPEGKRVLTGMSLGYPNVDYLRSVPRKKTRVTYK